MPKRHNFPINNQPCDFDLILFFWRLLEMLHQSIIQTTNGQYDNFFHTAENKNVIHMFAWYVIHSLNHPIKTYHNWRFKETWKFLNSQRLYNWWQQKTVNLISNEERKHWTTKTFHFVSSCCIYWKHKTIKKSEFTICATCHTCL